MADPRAELEARRALRQAVKAGDARAELAARRAIVAAQQAGSVAQKPQSQTSALGAGALSTGETILGNIAALPDVAARRVQGVRGLLAGQPGQALEAVRTQQLPRPSGREVNAFLAGVEALPGGLLSGAPVEAFQQAQAEQRAESAQAAQERPVATGAGAIAGDALTLLGLRVPGVAGRAALPARAAPVATGQLTVPAALRGVFQSKPVASLTRGLGRAGEAGAEGALISLLNENDPLATAGLSAGAQAAGSFASAALRNPGKTVLGTAALLLATRDIIPTVDLSVFEIADVASSKTGLAILGGLLLSGPAQRLSGRNQTAAAAILLDAVTALPRGGMQSAIDASIEALRTGSDAIQRVAGGILKDPDAFTPAQIKRFEQAARSGEILPQLEAMLEDRDFRERLEAVEQASPQQLAADSFRRAVEADTRERRLPKATAVAEKVARTLPRNDPRRRSFESAGPRTFVASLFRGPRPPAELSELSATDRRDVMEVLLTDLIGSSMARSRGRGPRGRDQVTGIDTRALRTRWLALPAATRESFPSRTRDAIEALADRQIPAIPAPLLAKALLSDGQLVQQLIGDRQQSTPRGLLR
jgi:hypothetical protein